MGFKVNAKRVSLLLFMTGVLQAAPSSADPVVSVSSFTVAASTAEIAAYVWRQVPNMVFSEGEHLSYIVKCGIVTAGYSTLAIQGIENVNGRPAYRIVSTAKSGGVVHAFYKVDDRNEAWLDKESLLSVRFEKHIREGKYRVEETTQIDQPARHFHLRSYRLDKNTFEEKEGDLPTNVMDVLGSLYYVRLVPLEVGQSYTMDVLSGEKVYPLVVKVKKRETIKVPAGKFDTFLVEPLLRGPGIFVAKGKKLEVWLTADERRIPVRMRSEVFIGHVSAELLPAASNSHPK